MARHRSPLAAYVQRMRRQDVRLLALARQGDTTALCEVGRRYLLGVDGFPRYLDLGLDYLSHPSLASSVQATMVIADALSLAELVRRNLLIVLSTAANAGLVSARLKLGIWRTLTSPDSAEAISVLVAAADAGCDMAASALVAARESPSNPGIAILNALLAFPSLEVQQAIVQALATAVRCRDLDFVARVLRQALLLRFESTSELADGVCEALSILQHRGLSLMTYQSQRVEALLTLCVNRGNPAAALLLGRALCGINAASIPSSLLTARRNVRRGSALLLRAADAGYTEAWTLLYRLHANGHGPVANPQMARFFLEKAAEGGSANAQRQLGALLLRSATCLEEAEQGVQWLHMASSVGDPLARQLLSTLLLPCEGSDDEANSAIGAILDEDAWVAYRLRVARDFGLTKVEAINVDVVAGARAWGLVVLTPVPTSKSSIPRVLPGLRPEALVNLRMAVEYFRRSGQTPASSDTGRRQRLQRLRFALERRGIDESLFFVQANSSVLSARRVSSTWAFHSRLKIQAALAD